MVVNEVYEEFFGSLSRFSQDRKSSRGQKLQRSKGQRASKKKTSWMRKRAEKKDYLQFQKLFHLHRGRLAQIILDNNKTLQCQIPSGVVHSAFKARWETTASFKWMESFPPHGEVDNTIFQSLIMEHEIRKNVNEMGKILIPGPDGIPLGHFTKKTQTFLC